MSGAKVISVETISEAIESAAKEYGAALKTWYPQHGNNAPAERNLTLHLAIALKSATPGIRLYAEPNNGETNSERIDLVAYEPSTKTLIVVEAKRFIEKSPRGLVDDVERIADFVLENDNNENGALRVRKKFGVLLTQTIEPKSLEWWNSRERNERGPAWRELRAHLAMYQDGVGAALVHAFKRAKQERQRHVLWSVWECPLQDARESD